MVPFHMVPPDEDVLIEYIDREDRLLLVAPRSEARRVGLACRSVGVILRDAQKKVCVRRKREEPSGRRLWDLTATGHVRFGESREDAAQRVLETELGIREAVLVPFAAFTPAEAGEPVHVTLFSARFARDGLDPERVGEHLFLDEDELTGVAEHMPEMLTAVLLLTIRSGTLWKHGARKKRACPDSGPALPA